MAGTLAFLVLWLGIGPAPLRPSLAAPPDEVPPLAPFPIPLGSGIYLLGGLQPSAAYLVNTTAGLVLIDSGLQSDAGPLKAQMSRLGLDWTQVCAILLTHAHWDHCGGAERLRTETGARIHAGDGDAGVLRKGGPREALYSAFALPSEAEFHPTTVDVALKGGETLRFGDVRFRALALPGHTPGSVCYLMERAGLRALFAGDVISMLEGDDHSPLRIWKPLGTYAAYLPPRFRGDARAYVKSLETLRALPVPDLVLPGHPRSDPTPQAPRISAERWAAMLDQGLAEMRTLAARYQSDGADFLDGEAKSLLPGLDYFGDLGGRAVYGFRDGIRLVLVDAPGGPGLRAFLEARLKALGRKLSGPATVLLTSCDPGSTAGLGELMAWSRPIVVARDVVAARACCPPGTEVRPPERWSERDSFGLTALALRGPGPASTAYRLRWAGKAILLTGGFPIGIAPDGGAERLAELTRSRTIALDYLASVFRLAEPKPDLWLPAFPVSGQNANLYDREWPMILDESYRAGYRRLTRRP